MDKAKQGPMLMMVGGALLAIGSFLAWGTAFGIGVSGMDAGGDGWFTLIGGLAVAAAGYAAFSGAFALPKWVGWAGVVAGLGIALINFFDIMGTEGVGIGIGMWVMIAGGALAIYGMLQKS